MLPWCANLTSAIIILGNHRHKKKKKDFYLFLMRIALHACIVNTNSNVSSLREFSKLETLVLDGNSITSHTKFPPLPSLRTLWVNKNSINNLATFIDHLVESVPNIKFLSMLNNDACPNFFNGGTLKQYKDYRHYVISRLRNLETLDDAPVTEEERDEAMRIYGNLETTRTPEGPVTNYVDITEPIVPPPDAAAAPTSQTSAASSTSSSTDQQGGGGGGGGGGSSRGRGTSTPTKQRSIERRHKSRSDKPSSSSDTTKTKTKGSSRKSPREGRGGKGEGKGEGRGGEKEESLPLPDVSELTKLQEELLKPPRPIATKSSASSSSRKKRGEEDSDDSSDWSSDSEDELIEKALQGLPEIDVDLPGVDDLELPDDEKWFES